MVTSSAKDATVIMSFSRWILVCGVIASFCGGGSCGVTMTSIVAADENSSASPSRGNSSDAVISIKNTTKLYADRKARFLNVNGLLVSATSKSVEENEITDKQDDADAEENPTAPLYGIYSDCLFRLSFQCVQRKLLVFIDRMSRLKSFNVIGDILSVVRTKKEIGPLIKESELEARLNPGHASSALSTLIEYTVERFLQNHVLRVTLPAGVTASVSDNARSSSSALTGDTIDINLTRALEETTGRKKGDKKMKKIMGMMMAGLMGKMAFMGPLMLLMIKLKAIKALILSKIALMLSLFQLFKGGGKKGGGGGGGHGKEVIIVHDSHGGGGHESLGSGSAWATGTGGWSGGGGGGGAGWLSGQDSYSQGAHTGGGDATYAGSDQAYATGGQTGGWGSGGTAAASHGWGRRSSNSADPSHYVAYKAYIPVDAEERKRK